MSQDELAVAMTAFEAMLHGRKAMAAALLGTLERRDSLHEIGELAEEFTSTARAHRDALEDG